MTGQEASSGRRATARRHGRRCAVSADAGASPRASPAGAGRDDQPRVSSGRRHARLGAAQMQRGPPETGWPSLKNVRRRPTLPRSHPRSTIGAVGLSFRVRNGTGRFPYAMTAETLWRCRPGPGRISGTAQWTQKQQEVCGQVLGLLVPVSSTCYHASTSGLSTQSSAGGLTRSTLWETSS